MFPPERGTKAIGQVEHALDPLAVTFALAGPIPRLKRYIVREVTAGIPFQVILPANYCRLKPLLLKAYLFDGAYSGKRQPTRQEFQLGLKKEYTQTPAACSFAHARAAQRTSYTMTHPFFITSSYPSLKPTCAVRMRQPLGKIKVSRVAIALLASGTHSRGVRGTLASIMVLKISR